EDLAAGDITARPTVDEDQTARAQIVAKQALVLCGGAVVCQVFAQVDPRVTVDLQASDAARLGPGQVAIKLAGPARSLLAGERTALNLLQRMSGVATATRAYVDAIAGRCRIVDTRKTMPGLRALDRYAVRCGGAHNHRNDLGSGVLIKENHILCAGGVLQAISRARAQAPHTLAIECEVQTLEELCQALDAGADIVMLDNMSDEQVREAVEITGGRALLEVSGGVDLARATEVSKLGIDVISVGRLTHSVQACDLSMLFVPA
ncbi:MAG: carboxylating nicotinate-nucleotide diphosphorylase, partial [Nannocystaceae bacterium]